MKRSHGTYSKRSRHFLAKPRATMRIFLKQFPLHSKVRISINPSIKKGRPFLRFNGRIGTVVGRQGNSYIIEVKDGEKIKNLIVSNVHLHELSLHEVT